MNIDHAASIVTGASGGIGRAIAMTQVLAVDGLRVGYRQAGRGRWVVLLHGYVGDGEATWHQQMNALSDEFQLVA